MLGYADANTFAGKDTDKRLDANDEIAFMARDAGLLAGAVAPPASTKAGSGVQVKVTDPLVPGSAGYVYLFRKKGKLSSGAGQQYVHYTFGLLSGDYKKTYKLQDGPNPENSLVTGTYYRHHFSDRWTSDRIEVTAPGSSGVDILDRHKALFAPGNCVRSENTFNDQEGAFITNKVGPVRAIRSYIGANSGPNTQRDHIFYDRREDVRTYLRVHTIPSIMDFFDYSAAAIGMTYRNELNQAGLTIDGNPDSPVAGAPSWEQVTGPQGSLTMVGQLQTSFTPTGFTSYYVDDSTPSDTQCTGDAQAYGSSGLWVQGSIPCTDPGTGCTAKLTGIRTMYFGSPGGDEDLGHLHRVQGRALAQVVARHPEVEGVGLARVFPQPTDEHRIDARAFERRRRAVATIDEEYSRRVVQELDGKRARHRVTELDVRSHRVTDIDRDPYARRGDAHRRRRGGSCGSRRRASTPRTCSPLPSPIRRAG